MRMNKIDDATTDSTILEVIYSRQELLDSLGDLIMDKTIELVANQLALDIMENNYVDIISKISPEAIANMAIAEAGAAVNETLHKKLPDKILEIERRTTEVYQRGLFGGLKRI